MHSAMWVTLGAPLIRVAGAGALLQGCSAVCLWELADLSSASARIWRLQITTYTCVNPWRVWSDACGFSAGAASWRPTGTGLLDLGSRVRSGPSHIVSSSEGCVGQLEELESSSCGWTLSYRRVQRLQPLWRWTHCICWNGGMQTPCSAQPSETLRSCAGWPTSTTSTSSPRTPAPR